MPLSLDTEKTENIVTAKYEINSFHADIDRQEIHVGYDKLDVNGKKVGEELLTLEGPDFISAILRAGEIAGTDVYGPVKQALYERIIEANGVSGTIDPA